MSTPHLPPFRIRGIVLAGSTLLAATPLALLAQTPGTDDLDQRLRILERQLEIQQEAAGQQARNATITRFDDKGPSLRKGDFELKLRGLVQADVRTFIDDTPRQNDSFVFRRIRPGLEGSFGKLVGFRLTPEFAGNGSGDAASIVDAYIDLKLSPAYTLRAGKLKGPVGLERLQSGSAIGFIERGFPTELAPNRELGIQLQGVVLDATLSYTLGYYNGTVDGRDSASTDVDNRKEIGALLFAEPFKNEPGLLQGLGFGIGGSYGSKLQGASNAGAANSFLPRYRSPGQQPIFNYRSSASTATASAAGSTGAHADGDHARISPQLSYYRNRFGLLGEYITSEQDLAITNTAAGPGAPTSYAESLEHKAWQVIATYVLSGEDASFRGVARPSRPYTAGGDGWGALELALRYGELEIDDDAFPIFANPTSAVSKATNWSVGLNWYLTSNVKAALNYTNTHFEGGGGGTAAAPLDREDEKTVFARLQLSF